MRKNEQVKILRLQIKCGKIESFNRTLCSTSKKSFNVRTLRWCGKKTNHFRFSFRSESKRISWCEWEINSNSLCLYLRHESNKHFNLFRLDLLKHSLCSPLQHFYLLYLNIPPRKSFNQIKANKQHQYDTKENHEKRIEMFLFEVGKAFQRNKFFGCAISI